MINNQRLCRLCKAPFKGRADKTFCTIACKNEYHLRLRRATSIVVRETNKVLHRNRSILLEILGKNNMQKKVNRLVLDQKKFNFKYFTGQYLNSKGKIIILRRKNSKQTIIT